MLVCCVKTIVKESHSFEVACLKKKKKERKTIWMSGDFLVRYFHDAFCTSRHVVGHEALENEWYIVIFIRAYKFTIFEILREFFVLASLHIESTQQKPNCCFSKQLGYCSCVTISFHAYMYANSKNAVLAMQIQQSELILY